MSAWITANEISCYPFNRSHYFKGCVSLMPLSTWDKLVHLLKDIISQRFWGTFEIRFEDGLIVNIRKTENIKL